jgi:hypothetical protein
MSADTFCLVALLVAILSRHLLGFIVNVS